MWAHCEILIACLTVLEYTREVWVKEWYERTRAYLLRTMAFQTASISTRGIGTYDRSLASHSNGVEERTRVCEHAPSRTR